MDSRLLAASTALNEGRKPAAIELLTDYLSDNPSEVQPKAYSVLLNLLWETGNIDDGLRWSDRAIAVSPRNGDILSLRGAFLRMAGRLVEAIEAFDRILRLNPKDIAAQINKGYCYNDLGNGKAAEAIFAKLVRHDPRNAVLQRALARAMTAQGKFVAAETKLRQILAINKRDVDAWLDLSAAASDRSDTAEALAVLERALQLMPEDLRLLRAKIILLRLTGERRQAIPILSGLLPHHGNTPWLLYELAIALIGTNLREAIALLHRAIDLAPAIGDYRLALAECLLRQHGSPEGRNVDAAYEVLANFPAAPSLKGYDAKVRADVFSQAADFSGVDALGSFDELGKLWASGGQPGALMPHLARVRRPADRHSLIDQHRLLGDDLLSKARRNPIDYPQPRPRTKIRIGFMSSDLRGHPVSYFAWPLFEHVDRDRFEIYCYSWYEEGEPDTTQHRIASMVDAFRWHPLIGSREAAQLIANDDLDILFELGGMSHMSKLDVMAWKPARRCASWLGYPHSTGLETIDYLLVDPFLNPPDPKLLIEKPLLMPQSWIAMGGLAFPDNLAITPLAPVRRNGIVTFGTANNPYKYNEAMLRTWAQVMARVPGSRFIFVRPESGSKVFVRNILAQFAAEGVSSDRIEFRAVRGGHMTHYNDIDVALDTFPQTGGTTTCEALWMGVPTVTVIGEALFERLSYSILSNAGLNDLCAATPETFIDIAVKLASEPDRIQALRTGLRDQIRAGPLGNEKQFARDFYDLIAHTVETSPLFAT
ncbi:tetratricopeptide repeat protein [Rhizorhabdus sp.]|uniref:tetratricopeptide repeat protein n=1 Tax=Rhizorhabdus sp. TaxID=1968843 RepID=UPI0012204732|nr:tetratricopeptide repeat protein [Rhizorhabdus sp.]MBD3759542.1 tetratricopeptide repeat protein [Rhizorhabdus sp.]TAK06266.1 MAG: tetratricopeptide repeat protein [Rhizorhabdus sp.]